MMTTGAESQSQLSPLERRLVNDFQRDLSLSAEPYRDMAHALGVDEETVLDHLRRLQASRLVSRVGPVFAPNRIGASTLVAARVPEKRLVTVAGMVNSYPEVNHNYERDHEYNLWFVVTAPDQERLQQVLDDIGSRTGVELLVLPMLRDYFIDLGFSIPWEEIHGQ
jgi:DNA-binding Lrp family transcriptional regulator